MRGQTAPCRKVSCRAPLTIVIVDGRMVIRCDLCERNRQGLCRDCPNPLVIRGRTRGRTMWCPACSARRELEQQERRREYRREGARLSMRRHRAKPGVRKRRRLAAREWRKLHPWTAEDRRIARIKAEARRRDPVQNARTNEYRRQWRAERRSTAA